MEHTTEELLLAAEVLKIAQDTRDQHWRNSDVDHMADTTEWTRSHPLGPYIDAAIKRLNEVATRIKSAPPQT